MQSDIMLPEVFVKNLQNQVQIFVMANEQIKEKVINRKWNEMKLTILSNF